MAQSEDVTLLSNIMTIICIYNLLHNEYSVSYLILTECLWPTKHCGIAKAHPPNYTQTMTQTALITGATRGLGAALAEALAPTHHIIAVGRTTGALEDLDDRIKTLGGATTLAPMDITIDPAMQQLCLSIFDRWGGLNLWFHAAVHAAPLTPASHINPKDFTKSVDINITATSRMISYVAPLLGADGKAVFFNDPIIGLLGGAAYFGSYGATKAAQIALARSWAVETVKTGPCVHIVTPNPMPTATRARFFPGEDRTLLANPRTEADRLLRTVLT